MEGLVLLLLLLLLYFLPTVVAAVRSKRNTAAIFVANLFLGWTVIGWIIALVWSLMYEEPK
ncbi:MAG: superinfection immunity protein [Dehalococcoidia bacterium]|nr:superinfection immunity protein [Dehalococcoidia bacterium]